MGRHLQNNLGNFDRMIRVLVGLALLCMVVFLEGAQRWWGAVGLVPLASGLTGWCPAYALLGFTTCGPSESTEAS